MQVGRVGRLRLQTVSGGQFKQAGHLPLLRPRAAAGSDSGLRILEDRKPQVGEVVEKLPGAPARPCRPSRPPTAAGLGSPTWEH